MKKIKVYDIPTRIFHALFSSFFIAAYLIAENVDDESLTFTYHMFLGLTLTFLVCLRIIWGLIGTRYARFSSFPLHPRSLFLYFKNVFYFFIGSSSSTTPSKESHLGHNPASSWVAIFLMTCVVGLCFSGVMMTRDINSEFFEDVHEFFANGFLVLAGLHIMGLIVHTIRYREVIGLSMLHGKKIDHPSSNTNDTKLAATTQDVGIKNEHWAVGVIFLLLIGLFSFYLFQHFDTQSKILTLFGYELQMGE